MFSYQNISSYQQQLNEGKLNCIDAVAYYLKKIKADNLNAIVDFYGDEAMERAKFLDEKRKSGKTTGKLHGVVVTIKDVIAYKDHKLSRFFKNA